MAAPPILLIHGFASDHVLTWGRSGWTSLLDRAGRSWMAPDLPGHGAREKLHDPAAYTVPALLAHLLSAMDDAGYDRQPVDVIGFSLGGELALELALAHPERVRRVIAGGIGSSRPLTDAESEALLAHVTAGAPLPEGNAQKLWALATRVPGNDPAALAACLAGLARTPRNGGYAAFERPVLLFAGERDELCIGIEDVAAALPNADLVRVPGRNHATTLSASALKQRALAFLEA
jgi:pimeloyl-ACP methyl ester carboxylesterase